MKPLPTFAEIVATQNMVAKHIADAGGLPPQFMDAERAKKRRHTSKRFRRQ